MKKFGTKQCSLLLGIMLFLTAVGCGSQPQGTVRNASSEESATEATEQVAELFNADLGEEIDQSGVHATLDHAYLSPYTFHDGEQEIGIIFYQITITNDTEESLAANFLSNTFFMVADGEAFASSGLRSARMITLQFGEDAEYFMENIEPGETRQGYVYMEVPADFKTSRLIYYPAAGVGDRSVAYSFEIAREDLEPAPDPVTPFDEGEE